MRRHAPVALALFTLLAIFLSHGRTAVLAAACNGATVTVASAAALPGESATIAIVAEGVPVTGLAGFEFTVSYDPAIAIVTGVQRGPGFSQVTANLQMADQGTVTIAGANDHGVTGDVVLAVLTVRAAKSIEAGVVVFFHPGNISLYSPEPGEIAACPGSSGGLTIRPAPTPTPSRPSAEGDEPAVPAPAVTEKVTEPLHPSERTSVSTGDGQLTVTVPPGAVHTEANITVAPLSETSQPQPGSGMVRIGGQVFEILIEDETGSSIRTFEQPLVFTFAYDRQELPPGTSEADLQVFYWDEQLAAWILVPSEPDPVTGTITATVDHLTIFAVMAASGLRPPADVTAHWARADVLKLVSLGIVHGFDDGTFQPELSVTRAQFAKMLVEAKGLKPESQPKLDFVDEIPAWALGHVAAAVKAGFVTGFDDNTFRPDERITREQMAIMAARALGMTETEDVLDFVDLDSVSDWARIGVGQSVTAGIINGFEDNSFRPHLTATRAQAAAVISRVVSALR